MGESRCPGRFALSEARETVEQTRRPEVNVVHMARLASQVGGYRLGRERLVAFATGVRIVVAATTPTVTWCCCGALEGGEPGARSRA
eukprot:COSAG02_NODE_7771_length_2854_cov_7.933575_4_plen_87_part_00